MFKKAIPLVLISGLVLGACNNNGNNDGAVPNNNETPMEDHNNMEPRVNDGQTGPNMDGLDNDRNGNGNNGNTGNGGIINDTNHNGVIMMETRLPRVMKLLLKKTCRMMSLSTKIRIGTTRMETIANHKP